MNSLDEYDVTPNQFKNLLAFAVLISDESPGVLNVAPRYILEKWWRYIGTEHVGSLPDTDRWQTGMHPTLRVLFDAYCAKWRVT